MINNDSSLDTILQEFTKTKQLIASSGDQLEDQIENQMNLIVSFKTEIQYQLSLSQSYQDVRNKVEEEVYDDIFDMFDKIYSLKYENKLSQVSTIQYRYVQKLLLRSTTTFEMKVAIEELRNFDQNLVDNSHLSVEEKKQEIVDFLRENSLKVVDLDPSSFIRIANIKQQLSTTNHLDQLLDIEMEIRSLMK